MTHFLDSLYCLNTPIFEVDIVRRVLPILIITLFLAGLFITPSIGVIFEARQENTGITSDALVNNMLTSGLPNDPDFRVALYHETNGTTPAHLHGGMNTNYTGIYSTLIDAGIDVDNLTAQDIQNYELTTANYDVLILADNCPRESITNIVKDFWLAGGGILGLDSAISYLGYAGILFRENESVSDGDNTFWAYNFNGNGTIVASHPVTQSYANDTELVFTYADWAQIDLVAFEETSVWFQTKVLAVDPGDANWGVAIAVDAYDRGGKVVQIGIPMNPWQSDWSAMIVDAIDWLAPKPKARIAFDMSHQPRISVDDWDVFSTLTDVTEKFENLRDMYVSNRYTFDKFVPLASGNFTAARLNQYDIIILESPDLNYSVADKTALKEWIEAGGGLMVLGDRSQLVPTGGHLRLNWLLDYLGMYLGENDTLDFVNAVPAKPIHPTIGSASSLAISYRNYIYLNESVAQAVWEYDGNIIVAAQEYGSGRVIMFGDMNILSNSQIDNQHNRGYASNVANWLSADNAAVLVYSDDPYDGGAYRASVAQVLNQKQVKFYMTVSEVGFNASVNGTWFTQDTWDLVIVDHCNYFYSSIYDGLYDYLVNGGRAIVNTFRAGQLVDHPIWNLMGVNSTGTWPSDSSAHIWDTEHAIFNTPFNMSGTTMTVTGAGFTIDGATVEVYDNATALAGFSSTEQAGNASIILRNDNNVLLNTFLLNNMRGDVDNSGYLDTFELWFNQITYMLETDTIPTNTGGIFDPTTLILIGVGILAVVIIIAVVVRKRGASQTPTKRKKAPAKKKK